MVTSFLVVMGGQLNIKERVFVAFAWLPKATVQVRGLSAPLVELYTKWLLVAKLVDTYSYSYYIFSNVTLFMFLMFLYQVPSYAPLLLNHLHNVLVTLMIKSL